MFSSIIVDLISKVSPVIGSALGGPLGAIIGSLISKILGVDMNNNDQVASALQDPNSISKLKELEMQLNDLQDARNKSSNDKGYLSLVRPLLALFSMIAIFADIFAIEFVTNQVLQQVLVVMLVILVWDIRQIYKFYFGSGDDIPTFLLKNKK